MNHARAITGKWNAMWHSSPDPKYATASSGHWFASARSIRPAKLLIDVSAEFFEVGVRLGEVFSQFVPSRSKR
jgi:hypothetical protein